MSEAQPPASPARSALTGPAPDENFMPFIIAVLGVDKPDPELWGHLDGSFFASRRRGRRGGRGRIGEATKWLFDRAAAAIALIILFPLLIMVAVAIKFDSPGPVLFKQKRIGLHGRHFPMYKFRTMRIDAEEALAARRKRLEDEGAPLFTIQRDPRITRVGLFLRSTSMDELPQLFNVLVGHMSLIGPRPPLATEGEVLRQMSPKRTEVRPGLTGLWQISGSYNLSYDDALRLDLAYVEQASWALDLLILAKTCVAVFRGDRYLRDRQGARRSWQPTS